MKKSIRLRVEQIEQHHKLDFQSYEDSSGGNIQSPEDKFERLHFKAMSHMNQCKNLDEFHDIVFLVDDTLIKANSLVLMARC